MKFNFGKNAIDNNNNRLIAQIFKMLPMYEEEQYWEAQRDGVVLELKGYERALNNEPAYLMAAAKILSLDLAENKEQFRKLIFEAINCIEKLKF